MKIKRFDCSLVTRLVLFGLMLIGISAVLRYHFLIGFLEKEQAQVAADQQSIIASYLAQDIGYRVQERVRYLERLALHLPAARLEDGSAMQAWLREHQELQPLFAQGMFVANVNGQILVDYPTLNGRRALSLADYPDFKRVHLALQEEKTVKLSIPASRLAYWNAEKHQWVVEKDQIEIMVGGSSTDVRLRKTIRVQ